MKALLEQAPALETIIRGSREYQLLRKLAAEINADPAARQLIEDFRSIHHLLQEKQIRGENLSPADIQKLQVLESGLMQNPKTASYLQAEEQIFKAIQELNMMLARPMDEIYSGV
ncbi:YlbF family regulator [Bacillus infantis]|uniref:YlbF family regulator n=1 Tax=Bacillus infantis TaxID=324767 RepID=UPI003CFB62BD